MWPIWKQAVATLIFVFIVVFLIEVYSVKRFNEYNLTVQKEILLSQAALSADILTPLIFEVEPKELKAKIGEISLKSGARISVLPIEDGTFVIPLASSGANADQTIHKDLRDALDKGFGFTVREDKELRSITLYAAVPAMDKGGSIKALVRLHRTIEPQTSVNLLFSNSTIAGIVIILTLCVLPIPLFHSWAYRQKLKAANSILEELSRGNFSPQIPLRGKDLESAKLATGIEGIAQKLNELINQARTEKLHLESVIGAMTEGVMAVSPDGKVALINDSFKKMFDISGSVEGKAYWESIRNNEVLQILDNVLEKKITEKREMQLFFPTEKTYQISAIPLPPPGTGALLILFDITEFKRLEKIKADFVANVSHELRTPLTVIKGYIETLEEEFTEDQEKAKRFLQIANKNTDRLINIVNDLLLLSEIEKKPELSEFDLSETFETTELKSVIRSSVESLKAKIESKGITLRIEPEDEPILCRGDIFLLEQLFINLIDNAVKYTPDRGRVKVAISKSNFHASVVVEDTGIGIAKEHLPRLFERFYRVDKAHSRKVGGTGLGLSIVKHIVKLHGGSVEVESEIGKGTKFTVTLPVGKTT